MVDYLVNRGSAVPGLWTDRGVAGEDVKIRDCLDENRPFEDIEWGMAAGVRRSSAGRRTWRRRCWTACCRSWWS